MESIHRRFVDVTALTAHFIPILPPVLDKTSFLVYDKVPGGGPLCPAPCWRNSVVVRAIVRTSGSISERDEIFC